MAEFAGRYNQWEQASTGKVRVVYRCPEDDESPALVALVATDGVSAFDSKLGVEIKGKGEYLTAISALFSKLADEWLMDFDPTIITAFLATEKCDEGGVFPPELTWPELSGRTTIQLALEMLPYEWVVRGYITGSLWEAYEKGQREFWGAKLPNGLKNGSRLPEPLLTPTTKAPEGQHDEPIELEEIAAQLEGTELGEKLEAMTEAGTVMEMVICIGEACIELYSRAADFANERGLILADTKFELGVSGGRVWFGDEILTPDSSRYWLKSMWEPGFEQQSLDKQIIRNDMRAARERGEANHVPSDEVLQATAERYAQLYLLLTGEALEN